MANSIRTLKGINYKLLDYDLQKCQLDELIKANETLSNILTVNTQIQKQTDELESQLNSIEQTINEGIENIVTTIENTTGEVNESLQVIESAILEGNVVLSNIQTGVESVDTAIQNLDIALETKLSEIVNNQLLDAAIQTQILQGIENQTLTINNISDILEEIGYDIEQIRQETSNIASKLGEIVNKPEATEILGCIKVTETFRTDTPSSILGLYGMRIYTVGEPINSFGGLDGIQTNVLGSTVVIKYTNEVLENIPKHTLRERFLQAYQELGLVNNSFKFDAYFEGTGNDGEIFIITDVPITDYHSRRLYKTNQTTNQIIININKKASLVKEFDKEGDEIVSKRKYYIGGEIVPTNTVISFFEGECEEEQTTDYIRHDLIENSEKIYNFFKSITYTVVEGTASITIDGKSIVYPINNVLGATFSSDKIMQNLVTINTNGKVFVTLIK